MGETLVGELAGIFGAAVKSTAVSAQDSGVVSWLGLADNRQLLVWDDVNQCVVTAKHPGGSRLLQVRSTSVAGRYGLQLPGGQEVWCDARQSAAILLSEFLGTPVRLVQVSGVTTSLPTNFGDFHLRPGMGVDSTAVHGITTASLDEVGIGLDEAAVRFRPTIIIRTPEGVTGFIEDLWVGRLVRIGTCLLVGRKLTKRCPETKWVRLGLRNGQMLPERRDVSRLTRRVAPGDEGPAMWMGIYFAVVDPGKFEVGDEVFLLN